jgi:DNA-binding MarR family transcriptional regulator
MAAERDTDPLYMAIAGQLNDLAAANLRYMALASRGRNVGMRELLALGFLRDEGSITPSELADGLGITTASGTALLDRLERAGYAHRERHPTDRRSIVVKLDPAGRREVGSLFALLESEVRRALTGMSRAEHEAIEAFLKAITQSFASRVIDTGQERDSSTSLSRR